jgi:hypothetical protein
MRVTEVGIKDGRIKVAFVREVNEIEIHASIRSKELPKPAFSKAWNELRETFGGFLGLDPDFMNACDTSKVRFKDKDENIRFSATFIHAIDDVKHPFVINTPIVEESEAGRELVDAINKIRSEAKKYASGDRVQGVFDWAKGAAA